MLRDAIQSETDIERLRHLALVLATETKVLYQRVSELREALAVARGEDRAQLELELKLIKERLAQRESELFGTKSERRGRPDGSSKPKKDKAPQTGHGPTPQPNLPIVEVEHELDEADQICPCCGDALGLMKDQHEESDEIDVIQRDYRIVRHKREKWRCGFCGTIETALGPDKLIPGGRYSVRFASTVAVDKYLDHLPLERQVRRMSRADLDVTSQTLWDQIDALAQHLEPTYLALQDHILQQPVLGADETTWRVMKPGRSKKWWCWSICTPDAVFHHVLPSRSADAAKVVLQDYQGTVIADGFGAYTSLVKAAAAAREQQPVPGTADEGPQPDFELACCWSHVRRGFFKADKDYPEASVALDLIAKLYAIEARARDERPEDWEPRDWTRHLRQTESAVVLEELWRWIGEQRALPKSQLGRAMTYATDRRESLGLFIDNPDIPIDNNGTERALRGIVLGRKNHQGSRSTRGTEVAAQLYSLVETAKLVGVNPIDYLETATRRAIRNPGAVLLPSEYAAELDTG